jgi:hypothetical protein
MKIMPHVEWQVLSNNLKCVTLNNLKVIIKVIKNPATGCSIESRQHVPTIIAKQYKDEKHTHQKHDKTKK